MCKYKTATVGASLRHQGHPRKEKKKITTQFGIPLPRSLRLPNGKVSGRVLWRPGVFSSKLDDGMCQRGGAGLFICPKLSGYVGTSLPPERGFALCVLVCVLRSRPPPTTIDRRLLLSFSP